MGKGAGKDIGGNRFGRAGTVDHDETGVAACKVQKTRTHGSLKVNAHIFKTLLESCTCYSPLMAQSRINVDQKRQVRVHPDHQGMQLFDHDGQTAAHALIHSGAVGKPVSYYH